MDNKKPILEDLLLSARNIAVEIVAFADRIEANPEDACGTADLIDFDIDCSYDAFISLLSRAGLTIPESALKEPDEALREKVNPILADLELDVDRVYRSARAGRTFLARTVWHEMLTSPEFPRNPGACYDSLRSSLKFLGMKPGSAEFCAFLDTDPASFKKVDQKFGRAAAYENLSFHRAMMSVAAVRLMDPQGPRKRDLSDLFRAAREYNKVYTSAQINFETETMKIMEQSGLSEQDVAFYIMTRLESEGRVHSPPSPLH